MTTLKTGIAVMALAAVLCMPAQAEARTIAHQEDPPYKTLGPEDPHPMAELLHMAEENDVRAQFIVADLYYKGKGGLSKNKNKGKYWFERAAKLGYPHSFVRLAAIAKEEQRDIDAYKWYLLGEERARDGAMRSYIQSAMKDIRTTRNLSREDIKVAEKHASEWKVMRIEEQKTLERELKEASVERDEYEKEKARVENKGDKAPSYEQRTRRNTGYRE